MEVVATVQQASNSREGNSSTANAIELHNVQATHQETNHTPSKPALIVSEADVSECTDDKQRILQKVKGFGNSKLHPISDSSEISNESRRPSSATSGRWKRAASVVMATNTFLTAGAEKRKREKTPRIMQGSHASIPVLPLSLAVVLLICNCIIPGLGTILSGFTYCCIATTFDENDRDVVKTKMLGLITTNLCIGISQFFTTTFLLIGWFWSVSWGVTMVYLAVDNRTEHVDSHQHDFHR